MNATGRGQRMQGHFNKTSLQRVDKQERFTLWTEQSPEDVGMKPADLKSITLRNCATAKLYG